MAATNRPAWVACALAAGGTAALCVPAWITGLPVVAPSLGPSLLLAAAAPGTRESAPTTLAIGHGIAVAATVATLAAFRLLEEPSALVGGVTVARMIAVPVALAATLAGMLIAGRFHPPAGATTLLVALGIVRSSDVLVLVASIAYAAGVVALFPRAAKRFTAQLPRSRTRDGGRHRASRR